MLKYTLKINIC